MQFKQVADAFVAPRNWDSASLSRPAYSVEAPRSGNGVWRPFSVHGRASHRGFAELNGP